MTPRRCLCIERLELCSREPHVSTTKVAAIQDSTGLPAMHSDFSATDRSTLQAVHPEVSDAACVLSPAVSLQQVLSNCSAATCKSAPLGAQPWEVPKPEGLQ
eukprot:TRINITY_DN12252_c0_g1_i7.p2 TRINITY_DN12252_c0_g1~~TRINITY_DN12252_c0_g1_i7.p2  ORF type:complete len:102 (+),score=5.12 TRINITY_DN12252_c0_g1_i7:884-1189(+)